jgi:hypothetical protein
LTAIETDGPYPGYDCTSKDHKYHTDSSDSIYRQTVLQGEFFSELRKREMFINQPDNYFFQGASKSGKTVRQRCAGLKALSTHPILKSQHYVILSLIICSNGI